MRKIHQQGMTLLEITMVLLLLSLLIAIAIPNFSVMTEPALRQEAKRLAHLIRTVKNDAVMTGIEQRISFSTKKNQFWVERKSYKSNSPWAPHPTFSDAFSLPRGLRFRKFSNQIPESSQFGFQALHFESLFGEEFQIYFDPSGVVDICQIEIAGSGQFIEIKIFDILGNVRFSAIKEER